jgi:hypothetical protein
LITVIRTQPVVSIRDKTRIGRIGHQRGIEPLGKMKILPGDLRHAPDNTTAHDKYMSQSPHFF